MSNKSKAPMLSNNNTLNSPPDFSIFTPPSAASTPSIDLNSPFAISETVFNANTIRYFHNILLILFSHHPIAVSHSELALFYRQIFSEAPSINQDFQYLLQTHPAIITHVHPHGMLYTLNTQHMNNTLKSFELLTLYPYIAQHILRAFTVYPNGIPCAHFEDTIQNLSHFTLSDLVPSWMAFVASIPYVVCCDINGSDTFINTFSLLCCDPPSAAVHVKQTESTKQSDSDSKSPFSKDHCSVFLGGFGRCVDAEDIRRELSILGVVVISCSEIKRRKYGYSFVTLASVKEADQLIAMSPIPMLGTTIDVRPFINREKQSGHEPDHKTILETVVELLTQRGHGLSMREMQPVLYRKLSYRIAGSDLVDIIHKNEDTLHIQKNDCGEEKIVLN